MNVIRTYKGSHVYIFSPLDERKKMVLALNPSQNQVTTPGFGDIRELSYEEAAKFYTEKQTGLKIIDLKKLREKPWTNDGKPFHEPNGKSQFISIMDYLATRVESPSIEDRIKEHLETENGRTYQPRLVEISDLKNIRNLSMEVPIVLRRRLNISTL
jgi:hypothetical protein